MKAIFTFIGLVILFVLSLILLQNNDNNNDNNIGNNLVIISSVIHTSSKPLIANSDDTLYYHQRSTISPKERFKQTLLTIKSVKKKIPNATIILLEGSKLSPEETKILLDKGVNYIHDESVELNDIINSPYKSIAEVHMILHFMYSDYFKNNYMHFNTFSKISGRYFLTDNFKFNKYSRDKVICHCPNELKCNTRYYRIPMTLIDKYIKSLEDALIDPIFANHKTDIEGYNIFKIFNDSDRIKIRKPDILGVAGVQAPWSAFVEDFVV